MKNKLLLLVLFFLVLIVYSKAFSFNYQGGGDIVYFYPENLLSLINPHSWVDAPGPRGMGVNNLPTLWIYWVFLPFGILYQLFGITFNISLPLVLSLLFLLLSAISISKLASVFSLTSTGKMMASAFYLLNSYILLAAGGGQLGIALAYALLPLYLVFQIRALLEKKFYLLLCAAFCFALLIAFDLRVAFLSLLFLGLFIFFFFNKIFNNKRFILLSIVVSSTITALVHSYWIMPLLKFPQSVGNRLPGSNDLTNLSFIKLNDALLLHQPLWPNNIFGKISPPPLVFMLVGIVVFLNLFFKSNRKILFLNVLALISIFLAKGTNLPFGQVNQFIFDHIPGFNLFRDPSKFMILEAISFSLLFGFSIERLYKLSARVTYKTLSILLGLGVIVATMFPMLMNPFKGFPENNIAKSGFSNLRAYVDQTYFGRTLYIPNQPPGGFSDDMHPSTDPLNLQKLVAIKLLNRGNYDISNFVRSPLARDLLNVLGINTVVLGKNFGNFGSEVGRQKYFNDTVSFLNNQEWLTKEASNSSFVTYATKEHQDKFSIKDNLFIINDSQQIYSYLKDLSDNFLSNNLMVFLSDMSLKDLQSFKGYKNVYLLNPEGENIKYDLLLKNYSLELNKVQGKWGRTKSITGEWESILHQNGIQYNLDSEADDSVFYSTIKDEALEVNTTPKNILLFKVYKNRRGGEIAVGNKAISTQDLCDCFRWESVEVDSNNVVVINKTGVNAIKDIVQVPPSVLQNDQLNQILSGLNILILKESTPSGELIKQEIFFKPDVIAGSSQTETVIKSINNQDKTFAWRAYLSDGIKVAPDQLIDYSIKSKNDANYIVRVDYLDNAGVRYEDELSGNQGYIFIPEGVDSAKFKIVWDGKTPNVNILLSQEKSGPNSYLSDPKLQSLLSSSPSAQVNWSEVDSTKYHLDVKTGKGKFLALSENYDPNWSLSGDERNIEGYGVLNSFYIDSDGEKIVLFKPQLMVDRLFPVSIATIVIGLLFAAYLYVKKI